MHVIDKVKTNNTHRKTRVIKSNNMRIKCFFFMVF